ncbi:unnamed protein product [Vitrella brassicaformis CCMP3155]|uniref:CAF1B/HIR1 beta-propeller domain-containing protein n=3 Tax=Vitrella brassicaformis TaxID=1169539 RepID=A0A0G4ET07_VITBC|nr:unnamed protein product [Vitrella brassicaformis CCMP3155]|eukprot:CEM00958.1 unnamed protein product [Vitrella brassicaformis CCMP3155]
MRVRTPEVLYHSEAFKKERPGSSTKPDKKGGKDQAPRGSAERVASLDFQYGSRRLATCGADNDIHIWEVLGGDEDPPVKILAKLSRHEQGKDINTVRWSPDGSTLASAGSDGTVVFWQQRKRSEYRAAFGEDAVYDFDEYWKESGTFRTNAMAWCLAWSPCGRYIAVGCDGTPSQTFVVDVVDGARAVVTLSDHNETVMGVTWDPHSQFLVTQSSDKTVKVWTKLKDKRKFRSTAIERLGKAKVSLDGTDPENNRMKKKRTSEDDDEDNEDECEDEEAARTKQVNLFLSSSACPSLVRRPDWSPDGSFFLTPSGQYSLSNMPSGRELMAHNAERFQRRMEEARKPAKKKTNNDKKKKQGKKGSARAPSPSPSQAAVAAAAAAPADGQTDEAKAKAGNNSMSVDVPDGGEAMEVSDGDKGAGAVLKDTKALPATLVFHRGQMKRPSLCIPLPDSAAVGIRFCPLTFKSAKVAAKKCDAEAASSSSSSAAAAAAAAAAPAPPAVTHMPSWAYPPDHTLPTYSPSLAQAMQAEGKDGEGNAGGEKQGQDKDKENEMAGAGADGGDISQYVGKVLAELPDMGGGSSPRISMAAGSGSGGGVEGVKGGMGERGKWTVVEGDGGYVGPPMYVFAVINITGNVYIYNTERTIPIAFVRGHHWMGLTDAAWSSDGRVLAVSSSDGYVSYVYFEEGELGEVLTSVPPIGAFSKTPPLKGPQPGKQPNKHKATNNTNTNTTNQQQQEQQQQMAIDAVAPQQQTDGKQPKRRIVPTLLCGLDPQQQQGEGQKGGDGDVDMAVVQEGGADQAEMAVEREREREGGGGAEEATN